MMLRVAWRWLVSRPERPMRPFEVIMWWELRRIPYNLIVGAAGAVSLVLFYLFMTWSGELKPGEDAVEPLVVMAAPFAINFCYTGGWVAELILLLMNRHVPWLGPILFVLGTVFSLVVIFAPTALWGAAWFLTLLGLWR